MRLSAAAWRLREAARQALETGGHSSAVRLASEAQRLQHTPVGAGLRVLALWLESINSQPPLSNVTD